MSRAKPPGEASFRKLYFQARCGARTRDIEFALSYEEFKSLVVLPCVYCGAAPRRFNTYYNGDGEPTKGYVGVTEHTRDRSWVEASGIDRYDNTLGYIAGNCVPCCKLCNHSKRDRTLEEFVAHCRRVVGYNTGVTE